MIGRGAIHNPWIFQQAKGYRTTGIVPEEPLLEERIDILKDHYKYNVEYKGEHRGVLEMRKHISGYLKGLPYISKFRQQLVTTKRLADIFEMLEMLRENREIKDVAEQLAEDNSALDITCSTESEMC